MPFLESKWPNDLEGQGQWLPFSVTTGWGNPKMHIWAEFGDYSSKLSRRQTKFPRVLSQNGKNNLEGQGQLPPFSLPTESIPGCMSGANLVILAQFVMIYRADKPNFLEFWVKMAKMTLKVKVNEPYCVYQLRVSHDACLVLIWWFKIKSVTNCHAGKAKFTDRRTDGQTDAGKDNTPSAWKAIG